MSEKVTVIVNDSGPVIRVYINDNQEKVSLVVNDKLLPKGFNAFDQEVIVTEGSFVRLFEIGEADGIDSGQICYLKNDGLVYLASSASNETSEGFLCICVESGLLGEAKKFLIWGSFSTSGLIPGERYHISLNPGSVQISELEGTTDAVTRCIGFALSENEFWFQPSNDFIVNI